MNIQTISIVVPTKGCVNKCPFCVSRMHDCPYENNWNEVQMRKRIQYAVMNGVNTCIITGTGEPLQNLSFLNKLENLFYRMDYPFPNIELQTTGVFLSQKIENPAKNICIYPNIDLLKELGVNTISLSVSDIFEDINNLKIIGVSKKLEFYLNELIPLLKEKGFNIRLSLNMLEKYDKFTPKEIIGRCKFLSADQVTFRKMYYELKDGFTINAEGKWTQENKCSNETLQKIKNYIEGYFYHTEHVKTEYIKGHGVFLYKLPFGGKVYSIEGMSTVMDDDCMAKENNETLKYIVLREDGKLYCRWDDRGSLIF